MLKYSSVILFGVLFNAKMVFGRFCDGGHRCSAPKECCAQGCCYLYAPPSPPKTPPPAVTDHVLNLFFINHWYFWCVVLAIILTLLCACSLWRKRRQLCGWSSSSGSHMYSEGDSAGSCYAPPQYSRCSSFHHAPPPYTEVTSKPDLYPLVFTCNGDGMVGAKNGGTGYLMVQYFRNYIVRPVGTLSATSTVESLSSSFICTVNEANTIVPPPYSRAASPEDQNPPPSSVQHHASSLNPSSEYHISRSESMHQQKVLQSHPPMINLRSNSVPMVVDREPSSFSGNYNGNQQPYLNYLPSNGLNNRNPNNNNGGQIDSTLVSPIEICINENRHSYNGMACPSSPGHSTVSYSRSEYQLRKQQRQSPKLKNHSNSILMAANDSSSNRFNSRVESRELINPMTGSLVVEREPSSGNRTMSASTQQLLFNQIRAAEETPFKSITVPTSVSDLKIDTFDNSLSDLRLNLDYTRAHQQRHLSLQSQSSEHDPRSYMDSPLNNKFDNLSYMSNTGSAVSSLVNMDSPRSPPQATSPTDEMRELLEQIRQLQHNNESKRNLVRTSNDIGEDLEEAVGQSQVQFIRKFNGSSNNNKPSSKRPLSFENNSSSVVLNSLLPETCSSSNKTTSLSPQNNNNSNAISYSDNVASKPRKSFYIPVKTEVSNHLQQQQQQQSPDTTSKMISPGARMRSFRQRGGLFKDIRSPTSRPGVFLPGSISTTNRKYGRLSRSAPTTPAGLPPNRFDDVSPLLDEHEEEEPML